jgi:stage II sporulation protein M
MKYKWWILVAIGLFGAGIAFGLADPFNIAGTFYDELKGLLGLGQVEGLSGLLSPFSFTMFIFIFIKNVIVLLFSFAFSPIFCLMPVLALTFNGWLVAVVSSMTMREKSLGFVLAGLLPHGIIELPAFLIGEAAALSFGAMVILALFKKEKRNQLLPNLKQNLKYLGLALALLLPAAIIETYITPLLVG